MEKELTLREKIDAAISKVLLEYEGEVYSNTCKTTGIIFEEYNDVVKYMVNNVLEVIKKHESKKEIKEIKEA